MNKLNLKNILQLLIILAMIDTSLAGGLRGGSTGDETEKGGLRGGSSNTISPGRDIKPRTFVGTFGAKYTYEFARYKSHNLYIDKVEAIDAAVKLNKALANNQIDKEVYNRIARTLPSECKNDAFYNNAVKRDFSRGEVRPRNFSLTESYTPDGQKMVGFVTNLYFPCKQKK
jgi:hypothetical protein